MKRRLPSKRGIDVGEALPGAILATLLDLAIEPVAAHVVLYWQWMARGQMDYYRVPLMNFVAWFVVAFVLVVVVDVILQQGRNALRFSQHERVVWTNVQKMGKVERLAMLVPCILFSCSLLIVLLWRPIRWELASDYSLAFTSDSLYHAG